MYVQLVERSFEETKAKLSKNRKSEMTGTQHVLQLFMDYPMKIWWWSWEIMGRENSKGDYISHRGPARASDLAIHHPDLVECRKIGRFAVYRARLENKEAIYAFLDPYKDKKILGMQVVEDPALPPNTAYLSNR